MSYIKIFLSFFVYLLSYNFLYAEDLRDEIVNFDWSNSETIIAGAWSWDWLNLLDNVILFFKDSIFNLLYLIVVSAFIYIWAKLVMARWKPDQFKKIWIHIIHIVVWIFVITWAWAIIKVVSWLSF